MEGQSNIKLAAERLKIWGNALNMLAQPEMAARLIEVLEAGNHKDLEAVIERTGLFQKGVCIDIVEIFAKVVNFGPGQFEERCDVVVINFITPCIQGAGKFYKTPAGSITYITDCEWRAFYERAQRDLAWRDQNKEFLKAIGVLTCSMVWVPDSKIVSVDRTRTICFPAVINPRD